MIAPYTSAWTERLKAEGEAKGEVKGAAKGKAHALILVLEGRDDVLTDETRNRILTCTDPDQIDTWLVRAGSGVPFDQIFDA
ncbi:hypothetical protein IDM40_26115 [Nocardiopsis sp. HNM0947]|uniref:Transposase n=1 Tax=Nocardiopsis coralli TaxID=2772213 RepID=A0ABR9PEB3_9ACTN|nr:hypothetical protein [Nocardiopsis coralli]MBE3002149.1 hypothetical protein [Nocardiopsis coralli]